MKVKDYETPKLLILLLDSQDVVTTSNFVDGNDWEQFDKGVEDFFSE